MMIAPVAYAQDTATTSTAEESSGEAIIVTGSRIARPDLSSTSPLVSVGAEALRTSPAVTLDDALVRLPQIQPSYGSASNNMATGGATTVALRGLGASRTLVLIDGRRLNAATYTGAVDLNAIPSALIESIEVITGGASAAYGSDAVAGVVNFRLARNFEGVRLEGQAGITERGDAPTTNLGLTVGGNFGDNRGNAVISMEYAHRAGTNNRDRAFSQVSRPSSSLPSGAFTPSPLNLPSAAIVNSIFAGYGVAPGAVLPSRDMGFNRDGTLFSQVNGLNYREGFPDVVREGGAVLYNSAGVMGLTIPLERYSFFGRVQYEVADDLKVYAEGGYQNVQSEMVFGPGFVTVPVPVTNPFIPGDLATILASRRPDPTASFSLNRRFGDVGLRRADFQTNSYRLLAGITGRIEAIDGSFDVFASKSQQIINRRDFNGVDRAAYMALLNAPDGGASLCAGGYNPFGAQVSDACMSRIRAETMRRTQTEQDYFEANVQGRLFSGWAGDVRFALGIDHRRDSYNFQPDNAVRTGSVIGIDAGPVPPVVGEIKVNEAFGELFFPLLRDIPLIREFNVTLGYRNSDYSTSGNVASYRAEGDWRIVESLRVRGGYSRAVRAPNVAELFTPDNSVSPVVGTPGAVGQGDPCDIRSAYRTGSNAARIRALCLAQGMPATIVDSYIFTGTQITDGGVGGGNLNLKPEKADTYTVGLVFTPRIAASAISNLSLSVDFYRIDLNQAIGAIPGTSIIQQCYNLGGLNPEYSASNIYCSLLGRSNQTGQINYLLAKDLNLGKIRTAGIDVSYTARFNLGGNAGSLDLAGNVNWTESYKVANFPGVAPVDLAGSIGNAGGGSTAGIPAAFPQWKTQTNLTYRNNGFQVGVQHRFIDKMIDVSAINVPASTAIGTPATHYFDVNMQYQVSEAFTFRLGIVNIGDKQPPFYTSNYQSNTYPGVFDVLGRSFYAGFTAKF